MPKREFTITQKIRKYVEATFALLVIHIVSFFCPYEKIYPLSKKVGRFFLMIFPKRKNIIRKNLSIIFPEKTYSKQELNDIFSTINGGEFRIFLEMLAFLKMDFQDMLSYIRINQHDQLSKMYHERHNNFVVCTLHYGNWELLASFMSQIEIPMFCLAERIDNPWLNKFLQSLRKKAGVKIVYNEISLMRPLLSYMKNKEGGVFFLADQPYWFNPLFIPFFNKEASIPQGVAGLVLKMKSNLFCMYTRFIKNGIYTINIDTDFNLVKDRDVFLNKEQLMKIIYKKYEEIIRYDVSNWWLLGYDRWSLTRESLKEWEKNPDSCQF